MLMQSHEGCKDYTCRAYKLWTEISIRCLDVYICMYIYIYTYIYIYIYTYIGLCSHLDSWQTTLDYDQFMSQLVKALVHLFGDAEEEVLANAHHALQVCTCVCM
jgi:hypothetical protein